MTDFLDTSQYTYYTNNTKTLLTETLKKYYPHILSAVENENYIIEYEQYSRFYELKYNSQIVGFITLEEHPLTDNILSVNEAYIIPKYRGHNLTFEIIKLLLLDENHEILIQRPNIAFIKILKKNNLCYKLNKDLYVSYIKFHIDSENIYLNSNIEEFYNKDFVDFPYKANVFDLKNSLSLFRDPKENIAKSDEFFICVQPRQSDLKKYNLYGNLKIIDEDFLIKRYDLWMINAVEITEFLENTKLNLLESIDVHTLIGSVDKLNDEFITKLDENNLSREEGFEIRKHIIKALYKNQISKNTIPLRISYLLKHIDKVGFEIGEFDENTVICPFCESDIPDNYNSCPTCGLHIREINFESYAFKKNFKRRYLILAFFLFIIYKIVKLFKRK